MSSEPSSLADLRYKCTGCISSLFPPVFQCHNGHLVCGWCSSRLKNCGACRIPLPRGRRVRNLEVEKIIGMIQHPCPNETEGCQAKLMFDQLEAHRIECQHSKFPICELLFGLRDCEEVRICDFEEHFGKEHGRKTIDATFTIPFHGVVDLWQSIKLGFLPSFKVKFERKTILFVYHMAVDDAHDLLKCKLWVLAGKAVANQLKCKISFLSGKDVKVTMDAPIFNLETKEEELLACAGIPWKYFQTNFPSPPVNETGKNRFRIQISKNTGTLRNEQASSAMDVSST